MRTPVIILAVALLLIATMVNRRPLSHASVATQVNPSNAMIVDAISGGAIDATRNVTGSEPFDVDINLQHGGSSSLDYSWFEALLCFNSTILDFVPTADLDGDNVPESWIYTDLGGMPAHIGVQEGAFACRGFPEIPLYGASLRPTGVTSASGVAATASFRCVGSGTTTLHLMTSDELSVFTTTGTRLRGASSVPLPTRLEDADITCSPPPTNTPCPDGICAPTATPSPTPTPAATATPDSSPPPNVLAVDAVSEGDIDMTRRVRVGTSFDVDIHIQHGGSQATNYAGYGVGLCFDSNILDFIPTEDLNGDTVLESWGYADFAGMYNWATVSEGGFACPTTFPNTSLYGGAIRSGGTGATSASGAALTARFSCVSNGISTIHLLTPEEHPAFYAATFKEGGLDLPNVLVDATIACLPDTDDDGCTDVAESQILYHPVDPSDFYSVPVPVYPDANPNGLKDQAVTVTDVVGVLRYVGTFEGDKGSPNPNGVAYDTVKGSCPAPFAEGAVQREGLCYDRSPSPLPNPPYDAGPPDGAVNVQDVVAVLRQVGLDCAGPP